MPIYEYRCPGCGHAQEAILSFNQFGADQFCADCGRKTNRRLSLPQPAIIVQTGRGKVLGTLNNEPGAPTFPGGDMHRPRYEAAMAKGLDQTRTVIGRGF